MIQQQSIKPASAIGSCLYIGQDRFGRWVVRDAQCLCGGLFANEREAIGSGAKRGCGAYSAAN
jgi:hypothetical protein